MNLKRREGITLVALVITIIVLLILAGITIIQLSSSGLFDKTKQAKEKSKNAQDDENVKLEEYEGWLGNYTGGNSSSDGNKTTLASKAKAGEYVTYTPDTASTTDILNELATYSGSTANSTSTLSQETGLKWRVLDVVDGKVRLISEVPTTSTVSLQSYNGYNNAVYLLDKTCKTLYSKTGYSENVQNLKIEDIKKYMVTKPTDDTNPYSPVNLKYPSILEQEENQMVNGKTGTLGLSKQETPIKQTEAKTATSLTLKNTFWSKEVKSSSEFSNQIYYDLFFHSGYCWLSSRCLNTEGGSGVIYNAVYRVRMISYNTIGSEYITQSVDLSGTDKSHSFRPVVTLNSNVIIKSGEGTESSAYEIGL